MFIRLFLILGLIGFLCWYMFSFKKQNPQEQKKSLQRLAIYGGCAVIVLLIVSGRISAIYALIAGLIPWFERAAIFKRLYDKFSNKPTQGNGSNSEQSQSGSRQSKNRQISEMSLSEAQEILGLDDNLQQLTIDDVNYAYKRLIQKNHPDSGGSAHIAQKIIEARKRLTDHLS